MEENKKELALLGKKLLTFLKPVALAALVAATTEGLKQLQQIKPTE